MLLLVWASSAFLTRPHYSQDYSPDKGALRGRLVRCICSAEVGKDLEVIFRTSNAGTDS